jgi:putative flavoprotein involved in K+ transport
MVLPMRRGSAFHSVDTTASQEGEMDEHIETVVIGGGQAGLTTGYYLKQRGRSFVILDANERIGDSWRNRWDSLRLFTAARYDGLPGLAFPAPAWSFPTKDDMADYLGTYASRFDLPVRTGVRVDSLTREGERFVVTSGADRIEADHVVVASGAYRLPKVPGFARDLDPGIVQMHSVEYRGPSQLREGGVLVVGVGNSGAEIAYEVVDTHRTWLAGKETGQIPVRHGSVAARYGFRLFRFAGHHVLTRGTPIGRRLAPKLIAKGDPLIRRRTKDLAAAGIERLPRIAGVRDARPLLEDGRVFDVENVIWCTGFRQDFSWIHLAVFDAEGEPAHERGVVAQEPGLYFVGLVFQYSFSSDALPSRGRDARYVAKHLASNVRGERVAERVAGRRAGQGAPIRRAS